MAQKLGVYLCDGDFKPPENISEYCADLIPTLTVKKYPTKRKLYEINGVKHTLAEWSLLYGKPEHNVRTLVKKGVDLELALENASNYGERKKKEFTAFGFTGTFLEVCEHFGVMPNTVRYRMNDKKMTLEEAVVAKPMAKGRPRKEEK